MMTQPTSWPTGEGQLPQAMPVQGMVQTEAKPVNGGMDKTKLVGVSIRAKRSTPIYGTGHGDSSV